MIHLFIFCGYVVLYFIYSLNLMFLSSFIILKFYFNIYIYDLINQLSINLKSVINDAKSMIFSRNRNMIKSQTETDRDDMTDIDMTCQY